MPRSCSSSDMAGTFMPYQPGTDGAAVTDVRLHGSRSSQHPELRNTSSGRKATKRTNGTHGSATELTSALVGMAEAGAALGTDDLQLAVARGGERIDRGELVRPVGKHRVVADLGGLGQQRFELGRNRNRRTGYQIR